MLGGKALKLSHFRGEIAEKVDKTLEKKQFIPLISLDDK